MDDAFADLYFKWTSAKKKENFYVLQHENVNFLDLPI